MLSSSHPQGVFYTLKTMSLRGHSVLPLKVTEHYSSHSIIHPGHTTPGSKVTEGEIYEFLQLFNNG